MPLYLKLTAIVIAVLAFATPALAYPEEGDGSRAACPSCHGFEESQTSTTTVSSTRKGPHGGYTTGTSKCPTCHSVHNAPADSTLLLPALTIIDTCNTCHDGTGGGGVYGVIYARTGQQPSGHRIGVSTDGKVTVPGGGADGGSLDLAFSAEGGGLSCSDCHSPHDGQTVNSFVGDRIRAEDETTTGVATNRLLRKLPTYADSAVDYYGSEWCASCHKGALRDGMTHPVGTVETTVSVHYNQVSKLESYDSTAVASQLGPLGGSNLGYVVPPGDDRRPICQQCHEDSRSIANETTLTVSTTESFTPSLDGATQSSNPRFQNFPHETVNESMLIEARDSLCLNCHDVASGSSVH